MPTIEEKRAALKAQQAAQQQPTIQAPGISIDEKRARLKAMQQQEQATPPTQQVLNEAADLSGRFMVKNFGGTIEDQLNYLRSLPENQGFDIQQIGGEIVARKPGETSFKKLDPSTPELADIGDVAYDVLSGIGTGAATTAAGLATGGLGAVGTGAATSAGAEALRQAIGKGVGTSSQFDLGNIGIAGALGGLTPAIFGSGATAAQVAKKAADPMIQKKVLEKTFGEFIPDISKVPDARNLTEKIIGDAQKSLLSRGKGGIRSALSGIDREAIKNANEIVNPKVLEKLAEFNVGFDPSKQYTNLEVAQILQKSGKIQNLPKATIDMISEQIGVKQQELGAILNEAFAGQKIDVTGVKEEAETLLETLKDQYKRAKVPEIKKQIGELRKFLRQNFPSGKPFGGIFGPDGSVEYLIERGSRGEGPVLMDADVAMNIRGALADFIEYQNSPLVVDAMGKSSKAMREAVKGVERNLSSRLDNLADSYAKMPNGEGVRQAYYENKQIMRDLFPKFKNENTALTTLKNLGSPRNQILRNKLNSFDNTYKSNVSDLAKLANVWAVFGDPALEAVSTGGATSTSKLLKAGGIGGTLGWVGGLMSGIPGAAPTLGALGGTLGSIASSPAAMATSLKGSKAVERMISKMTPEQIKAALPYIGSQPGQMTQQSIWNMMRTKQ